MDGAEVNPVTSENGEKKHSASAVGPDTTASD
jgi:hypothetical protein